MQRESGECLSAEKIRLFVFQPNLAFYRRTSFKKRLAILEHKINIVKKYLQENMESDSQFKNIFVAPEYLFKDFSKKLTERYYSHKQKEIYIETLEKLSKDTDLIIAPGTICYSKISKKDNETYFRNVIHFFHRGEIKKYKKANPSSDYDYDYMEGDEAIKSLYYRGDGQKLGQEADSPIININNMCIGIEICMDNNKRYLSETIHDKYPEVKIDFHLIVADGVLSANLLEQHGLPYAKVERNTKNLPTIIGTVKILENSELGNIKLICPNEELLLINHKDDNKSDDDLKCYQFSKM